jgi:dTDP-4-amino-4,6-dideoxygalactose transaminase
MHVPFLDLQAHHEPLRGELLAACERVIDRGQFVLGPAVEEFESAFATFLGSRNCVGVNNGTSALHLALLASGIGPGDEVITSPHAWIGTSWAIAYVGATPVFVDIDPATWTLDALLSAEAITPRTKAILPMHLYGQAADLARLEQLARDHDLVLIEDVAQAAGARHDDRRVGTIGLAGCFCFEPAMNLGAFGSAGAVVTDDDDLAERIRRLRNHAQAARHQHVEIGFNMRMDALQAAVLAAKLPYLDRWNEQRRRHAQRYGDLLRDVPGLVLPLATHPDAHVWQQYVVLVEGADRDAFRKRLADRGISTAVSYPTPVPFQPAFAHLGYRPGDFPIAEHVMHRCVSLPMFAELSDAQIEAVCDAVHEALTPVGRRVLA